MVKMATHQSGHLGAVGTSPSGCTADPRLRRVTPAGRCPGRTAMISTRDLSRLPDVDALRRLLQNMAMLDAILSPEWEYRYYSFNSKWARGEQMGSMRDGCGDDFFAL